MGGDPVNAAVITALGPVHNPVRGMLDLTGAVLAAVAGAHLVGAAGLAPDARLALGVLAASWVALFAVSALYHSVPWSPRAKKRMQRLDHSMIYLKIAGTVTPLAWLLVQDHRVKLVAGAWGIAVLGIAQKALLPQVHEKASIPFQVAQAALAVPALVAFAERFPGPPLHMALLAVGLYLAGLVVFLTQRPRGWRWFTFHDLFHLLLLAGGGIFFGVVLRLIGRVA
jgi:hemolysin III